MGQSFQSACVTGGAGFIGSHVVERLLAQGIEVNVLDNLSVGRRENVPRDARLIVGDVLDPHAVAQAVAGCDVVFHLAARVAIRSSFEYVVEDTMTNVVGTARVLQAAQQERSIRKVVFASSMAVYADAPGCVPLDEEYTTDPISPYGISKLAAEQLTLRLCAASGIASAVLRLFNTYGPRQTFSPYVGVVTIFTNQLLRGERPRIFGDGEQCRDFVHVHDVASAFLRAMECDLSGEVFNIGSGVPRSVNAVHQSVARALGVEISPVHTDAVAGELRYSVADIGKAQRLLRYSPGHDFDRSLDALIGEIACPRR